MGIRNTVLAAAALNTAAPATKEDRAPAEFYLNIGIETGDPQFPFLDLHKSGIALDRVPEHEIRGDERPLHYCDIHRSHPRHHRIREQHRRPSLAWPAYHGIRVHDPSVHGI